MVVLRLPVVLPAGDVSVIQIYQAVGNDKESVAVRMYDSVTIVRGGHSESAMALRALLEICRLRVSLFVGVWKGHLLDFFSSRVPCSDYIVICAPGGGRPRYGAGRVITRRNGFVLAFFYYLLSSDREPSLSCSEREAFEHATRFDTRSQWGTDRFRYFTKDSSD